MSNKLTCTEDYKNLLSNLKHRVSNNQIKAALKVNYELIDLYWTMGENISKAQKDYAWGDNFLNELSSDLQKEFPNMKGFSNTNLKYIKRWYNFYTKRQQAVAQNELDLLKQIPWGHNIQIITKCKDINEAIFYVHKTIECNWSRSVLLHQIESKLYERNGKAITNFENKLPKIQSDLANQLIKDPYNFDFLSLTQDYNERALQNGLINKISDFMLELGEGFAYIGKEYHLTINGDDFYIDLLFYNLKLHCYFVIELKTEKFKPEHLGQLNFYVTAVNRTLRTENDNQTIGLLICKDKNNVVCEYSLENVSQPIGISKYEISKFIGEDFANTLPSIDDIEKEFKDI